MLIHPRSDVAVHVHWLPAVTVTDPEPPDAPNERDEAESEYVHGPGVGWVGEPFLPHAENPAINTTTSGRDRKTFFRIVTSIHGASSNNEASVQSTDSEVRPAGGVPQRVFRGRP
jgi:hypothetical protein